MNTSNSSAVSKFSGRSIHSCSIAQSFQGQVLNSKKSLGNSFDHSSISRLSDWLYLAHSSSLKPSLFNIRASIYLFDYLILKEKSFRSLLRVAWSNSILQESINSAIGVFSINALRSSSVGIDRSCARKNDPRISYRNLPTWSSPIVISHSTSETISPGHLKSILSVFSLSSFWILYSISFI